MRNTLHTQVRKQLTKPRPKPRSDDMRQMLSDLQAPAKAEESFATSIQEKKPVTQQDIWDAFKDAAKPGVTTETDNRFVKNITFGEKNVPFSPGTSAVSNVDGVPVQNVNFRRGFSLTAEATGLRVSGSITGFLSGVRLQLTEEGLHLSDGKMTQTIGSLGSQKIVADDPGDPGNLAEITVTPQGRVEAKLKDGTVAGRRKTRKKNYTLIETDRVGSQGELKVGDREFMPFLKFQDMDHIREVDAERTVSDASSKAWSAESRSYRLTRSPYGREALHHARYAESKSRMAERTLFEGDLRGAESLAVDSLDSSMESTDFQAAARRDIYETRRREEDSRYWGSSRRRSGSRNAFF